MAFEIEKKYLVLNSDWKNFVISSFDIVQGYLSSDPDRCVRVRIFGDKAFITIKGKKNKSIGAEFEYEIPRDDAKYMLDNMCLDFVINKTRYICFVDGYYWDLDVFSGLNEGLMLAEIEISKDNVKFPEILPSWIGEEVTEKKEYFNVSLSKNPFKYINRS
ncbi:CYTH domain-containing protein [bacterium]|nr:CYTH domain-containing protein [bacterium]